MGRRRKRRKIEEGTSDAFRFKKKISKITVDEATAIMNDIDTIYQDYKPKYDESDRANKEYIETEYLSKVIDDITRIKQVGKNVFELQPGVMGAISDVFYNMKYTQLVDKREVMAAKKLRAEKKLAKLKEKKNESKRR